MEITTYRDIQLLDNTKDSYLAIACDVSAGIGNKQDDVVQLSAYLAGYYATAVPFIELISIGAKPISVIDTLGVEMYPTGFEVIEGIKHAMKQCGVETNRLTGSTEDNMPTRSTSVGITVVSTLLKKNIEAYKPSSGHYIYLVGLPKMGQTYLEEEVHQGLGEVITIEAAMSIRETNFIKHMLPIGSKGVMTELNMLSKIYGLTYDLGFDLESDVAIDLNASAGPASCMIVTSDVDLTKLKTLPITMPIHLLGAYR